ncbi:hypothetical protein P7C70_g2953, partial [Phenoliferia sp. Uapishka_3]
MQLSSRPQDISFTPRTPPSPAFPRLRPAIYPSKILPQHLNLFSVTRKLPVEILVMILDCVNTINFVGNDDGLDNEDGRWVRESGTSEACRKQTLSRCCRVSRSLRGIAERLLYRRLNLSLEPFDWVSKHVLAVLLVVPRLALCVKELYIVAGSKHLRQLEKVFPLLFNLLDFRLSLDSPTRHTFDTLTTLLRSQQIRRSSKGIRAFSFRMNSYTTSEWPGGPIEESLSRMLSLLPPTLVSLTITAPPIAVFKTTVRFALTHLHLSQDQVNLPFFNYLTRRSHNTLSSLVFETPFYSDQFPDEDYQVANKLLSELRSDSLQAAAQFPLKSLAFLGFHFTHPSSVLPALAKLPSTIKSLKVPGSFDIVGFLESESCPELSRFMICGENGYDTWIPTLTEEEDIKKAARRRGLFLLAYVDWDELEWLESYGSEDEEEEGSEGEDQDEDN